MDSRCRQLVSGSILGLSVTILSLPSGAVANETGEKVPSLIVEQRLAFERAASAAVDLRWYGRRSLLLLRDADGVDEVELEAGLPVARPVLPGHHQVAKIYLHKNLAFDGKVVATSGVNGQVLSTELPATGAVQAFTLEDAKSSICDFDLAGEKVVLLGWSLRSREVGHHFLWSGALDATLSKLEPVEGIARPAEEEAAGRWGHYMGAQAGALRALSDGDLLVYSGFDRKLVRLSSGGKVEGSWDLAQLAGKPIGAASEDGITKPEEVKAHYWQSSVVVDDVLGIGKRAAAVVREKGESATRWFLVLLDSDTPRRYAIPVRGGGGVAARVRADADREGRIAFLVGTRESGSDEAHRQEVIVATLPD